MKEPKISVLMPVYKGDKYLSKAVDSILNQNFKNFEFIVVCDNPTDETKELFNYYQQKDSRIKIFYQDRQGLVKSLNKGISLAKGEYIVRMDADDISLSDRLEKQVEFMDKNPDIGVSGTWVKIFGEVSEYTLKHPIDDGSIKSSMLFFCPLAHPSVIIRKDIFCNNGLCYRLEETYAEDYGLWARAANILKFANLPHVCLKYRMHNSNTNSNIQKKVSCDIRLSQIRKLGINPTKLELETHETLSDHTFEISNDFIHNAKLWLEKLQAANSRMRIYPEPAFSNVLLMYWYTVCYDSVKLGTNPWSLFHDLSLIKSANLPRIKKFRLFLKPGVKYIINKIK